MNKYENPAEFAQSLQSMVGSQVEKIEKICDKALKLETALNPVIGDAAGKPFADRTAATREEIYKTLHLKLANTILSYQDLYESLVPVKAQTAIQSLTGPRSVLCRMRDGILEITPTEDFSIRKIKEAIQKLDMDSIGCPYMVQANEKTIDNIFKALRKATEESGDPSINYYEQEFKLRWAASDALWHVTGPDGLVFDGRLYIGHVPSTLNSLGTIAARIASTY